MTSNSKASKATDVQATDVQATDEATGEAQAQATDVQATGEAQAQGTLDTSAVAALAGASPKDFRRWLRASARAIGAGEALPGKGGRYAYTPEQAEALALAYGRARSVKGTHAPAAAILAALTPDA